MSRLCPVCLIAAGLMLSAAASNAQPAELCGVTAEDFAGGVAELFVGSWQIEYLPGTFSVAGMVRAVPPSPAETFDFAVERGGLRSSGMDAFGDPEFRFVSAGDTGNGELNLRYDEALDLFTPADCEGGTPTLYADGEMVTPDGTLDMDIFLSVESLSRMPGAIVGNVENALFIRRPIVLTRLGPVPEMPDDLLPVGDGSPGSTAPGDDLLPIGDGSPGSTPPEDDLLPIGDGSPGSTAPGDDLLPIGDGSPGSTAPGDDLLPIGDGSPGSTAPDDDLLPIGDGSPGSTAPDDDLLPVPGDDDLLPVGE